MVRIEASNMEVSRSFYEKALGHGPMSSQGCFVPQPDAPCFHLNLSQQLEIVRGNGPRSSVETVGFLVGDIAQMREYLLARNVKCGVVKRGNFGDDKSFDASDPEGHAIHFIGAIRAGSRIGYPADQYLIHAGFVVRDAAAEDKFYKDILGFHVYWHGGMKDGEDNWVDMQVPDGTDWIEYMLKVPENASHKTLGVMNHIALGVPDIHAAQEQLIKNGFKPTEEPKIGRDGKWQLNLYDPDDTRVELMEFTPTQKPCCADYTGPHPHP